MSPRFIRLASLIATLLSAAAVERCDATTRYVSHSGNHISPFTNWATAANDIQSALNVCATGDVVLVTNGVYRPHNTGPAIINISNGVHLLSMNGPGVTRINGSAGVSGAVASQGATIEGFGFQETAYATSVTLSNARLVRCSIAMTFDGTGLLAYNSFVDRCRVEGAWTRTGNLNGLVCFDSVIRGSVVAGNFTEYGLLTGLIASNSVVENCVISGNRAHASPGGAILTGGYGINCIGEGNDVECLCIGYPKLNLIGDFSYSYASESTPGVGNLFGPQALRSDGNRNALLVSNALPINAGTNLPWMVGAVDIDGNPRILESAVDMGVTETLFDPVDLRLTVSHPQIAVNAGDIQKVAVVVSNAGPGDATSVYLAGRFSRMMGLNDPVLSQGAVWRTSTARVDYSVGFIPAGGTATILSDFQTAETGSVVETWSVSATAADIDTNDNIYGFTNLLLAPPSTDLAVETRESFVSNALFGDRFSAVFVVTNKGLASAGGVTVDITRPSGIGIAYVAASQGTWSSISNGIRFNLLGMPPGHFVRIVMGGSADNTGTLTTRVSVASMTADSIPTDNAVEMVTSVQGADVGVSLAENGAQRVVATVTSDGPLNASNVVVQMNGPVTFFDYQAGVGSIQVGGSSLTWTIPTLPVGQSATVTARFATAPLTAQVQLNVSHSQSIPDHVASNNTASLILLTQGADVAMSMTSDGDRSATATITCNGPEAASNVVVTLSGPVSFIKASTSGIYAYQLLGSNVVLRIQKLNPGASAWLSAEFAARAGPETQSVHVAVQSTTQDLNPLNDQADATFRVTTRANRVPLGSLDYDLASDPMAYFRGNWQYLIGPGWWGPSKVESWTLGNAATIPVPAYYGTPFPFASQLGVYVPRTAQWIITYVGNDVTTWGDKRAVPVVADYDGDRVGDLATYLNGVWKIRLSGGGSQTSSFGTGAMIPVPADYDGDWKSDLAVFSPVDGMWWYIRSIDGEVVAVNWGWNEVIPAPGDYDGDERADQAVYHPAQGMWYINRSHLGPITIQYGWPAAFPVPNDYDGDRITDLAVHSTQAATWYIFQSASQQTVTRQLGTSKYRPAHLQYQINRQYGIVP